MDFFGETFGAAAGVGSWDFDPFFAVRDDRAGEIEDVAEVVNEFHVFEGAGEIFGDEEVIAFFEPEAFAYVFEAVAVGPADADGFFGEGADLAALLVELVFGFDPDDLVKGEVFLEGVRGVEF